MANDSVPVIPLHRMAGATKDWSAIRSYGDPIQDMRDRMNRRAAVLREQRRIGIACVVLSVGTVIYMACQFARLVIS